MTPRLTVERMDGRLTPAWGLDPAFGAGGTAAFAFGSDPTAGWAGTWDGPTGVAVGTDGRVVVVGQVRPTGSATAWSVLEPGADLFVARLTADGSLDATFAGDGRATALTRGSTDSLGLTVLPDGRVAVYSGAGFDPAGGPPAGLAGDFFALDDANFRGGVNLAVGLFDGDDRIDLTVGAGAGGPRVVVWNGTYVAGADRTAGRLADFTVGGAANVGRRDGVRVFAITTPTRDDILGVRMLIARPGTDAADRVYDPSVFPLPAGVEPQSSEEVVPLTPG